MLCKSRDNLLSSLLDMISTNYQRMEDQNGSMLDEEMKCDDHWSAEEGDDYINEEDVESDDDDYSGDKNNEDSNGENEEKPQVFMIITWKYSQI